MPQTGPVSYSRLTPPPSPVTVNQMLTKVRALKNTFEDTEADFKEHAHRVINISLKPRGDTGSAGVQGIKGNKGPTGPLGYVSLSTPLS